MAVVTVVPSAEEVLQIPVSWTDEVPEDWIDMNNHMNIRHYLDLGGLSTDQVIRNLGIDDDYRASRRMGLFTAEQHLTYLQEMRLGTPITAHVRVLDRSSKVCHLVALIMDREKGLLACIFETVLVHVDLDSRRGVEFPDDIAAAYDHLLADDHASYSWPAPVCGIMGPRAR
ncbi:thioesterase family protein [Citricoccus nitrophenolicus]